MAAVPAAPVPLALDQALQLTRTARDALRFRIRELDNSAPFDKPRQMRLVATQAFHLVEAQAELELAIAAELRRQGALIDDLVAVAKGRIRGEDLGGG